VYRRNHRPALCHWLAGSAEKAEPMTASDWPHFVQWASDSGVLPALQPASDKPPLNLQLPEDIADLLATVHSLNTDRNRTALSQVEQIAAGLNRVGVQPVALKGLANILTEIYPDLGTRYLADIDLLVPENQFPAALAVFHELGYTTRRTDPLEFAIGHSHPPLIRPYSLEVDLHRTVGLGICSSFLPAAELIKHATTHSLQGASLLVPSPTHLVMHHIMHSQMHDVYRERVSPKLRTLHDFFLLHRHFSPTAPQAQPPHAKVDWPAIEAHFRSEGQYATLALYLLEAQASFGIEPPIPLRLTPAIHLRRHRRALLQKRPALRFLDPSYYWFAGFQPRTRRLREILSKPGGLRYLLGKLYKPEFYARLLSDFN
jgi:Uncharacterised nucleotidyltransferase